MPTQKLRLAWNQIPGQSQYTFSDIKNQNPLGDLETMNSGPGPAIYHPEDFGGTYNANDVNTAKANYNAIQAIIAAMPDTGGIIEINSDFFCFGTITNPNRTFSNGTPNPINFIVRGATGNESWWNLDDSAAFVFDSENSNTGYAVQYPSTVHRYGLQRIQVASKGNGVEVYAGGKNLYLEDVIIFGCYGLLGLYVQDCDAMQVRRIYCINNHHGGAWFQNCHQVDAEMVCRNNAGGGLAILNSASWRLWANCESNWLDGVVIQGCQDMDLHLWQEGNNTQNGLGDKYVYQGQINSSTNLQLFGNNQQNSALDFKCDALSRANLVYVKPGIAGYQPYVAATPWPSPFAAGFFGSYPAGFKPVVSNVGNQMQVAVPIGSYSNQPGNVTGNWLEIFGDGHVPALTNVSMNSGDSIAVRIQVSLDAVAAAYFADKLANSIDAPAFKFVLQPQLGVGFSPVSQTYYWASQQQGEVELIANVTDSFTDNLRLFAYFCPVVLPGSEPPAPHNLFINGVQVYLLPGS